jgi:4-hydroxy-4-methyl-2-oxoglutarate aldolase
MAFRAQSIDFPWTTPFIADGCVALGLHVRLGRRGLRPIFGDSRICGPVCPAKHSGSVDVFLEAIAAAQPGDVLVIDNNARLDEGCIGDLIAGEAQAAGLAGIIVDGVHRDTMAIRALGVAVWSLGTCPAGPQELHTRTVHALEAASVGPSTVTKEDMVFADDDGVVFVAAADVARVLVAAKDVAAREQAHADRLAGGERLRAQFRLDDYIEARRADPELTFREHLKRMGGAIEI